MANVILIVLILMMMFCACLIFRKYAWGIFNFLWAAVLFLCRGDICQPQYAQTMGILLLMIGMVNVGCAFGNLPITLTVRPSATTEEDTVFQGRFLRLLLLIACAILLFYAVRTVARFGLDLQLIRAKNNSDSDTRVFSGLVDTILFYGIAVPIIYVGALCATYNFSRRIPTDRSIYLLLAADMLLYVLSVGGRSLLVRIALFLGAALLWRLEESKHVRLRLIAYACLAVGLLLLLMDVLTSARNSSDISFLEQTVRYIRGSLSHMRYQLDSTASSTVYAGYITYGGFLYYPVKLLSKVLDLDWKTSSEIMSFLQQYKYLRVGDSYVYYNALVPNAFYYYYDSGYMGVAVFSTCLGTALSVGERGFRQFSFLKFVLWATAFYAIVYSPFGGALWTFRYPMALIYCVLLRKRLYKPLKTDCGG